MGQMQGRFGWSVEGAGSVTSGSADTIAEVVVRCQEAMCQAADEAVTNNPMDFIRCEFTYKETSWPFGTCLNGVVPDGPEGFRLMHQELRDVVASVGHTLHDLEDADIVRELGLPPSQG